jgi:hypothetical protein
VFLSRGFANGGSFCFSIIFFKEEEDRLCRSLNQLNRVRRVKRPALACESPRLRESQIAPVPQIPKRRSCNPARLFLEHRFSVPWRSGEGRFGLIRLIWLWKDVPVIPKARCCRADLGAGGLAFGLPMRERMFAATRPVSGKVSGFQERGGVWEDANAFARN